MRDSVNRNGFAVRQIFQSASEHDYSRLEFTSEFNRKSEVGHDQLEEALGKRRSSRYINLIAKLDSGGRRLDQRRVQELIASINDELVEIDMNLPGLLRGIIAPCYLGVPYEVHTLDFAREVVEHYAAGRSLPNGLEKARGFAKNGGYAFVEVYDDLCCCVSRTGDVSVIRF